MGLKKENTIVVAEGIEGLLVIPTEYRPSSYKNIKKTTNSRLAMTTRVNTDTIPSTKLFLQIGHRKYFRTTGALVVWCLVMDDTII